MSRGPRDGGRPLEVAGQSYRWVESVNYERTSGWAHHDVAALSDGFVLVGRSDSGDATILDSEGRRVRSLVTGCTDLHGLCAWGGPDDCLVVVADNGFRAVARRPSYVSSSHDPRVVLLDASGQVQAEFAMPDSDSDDSVWRPTAVLALEHRGRRLVWVADGYATNAIHRYDCDGRFLGSLPEVAFGKAWDTPHALAVVELDAAGPAILVADRGNDRIVVMSPDGMPITVWGADVLRQPSGLAVADGLVWVTELGGSLSVLSTSGQHLARIAPAAAGSQSRPGWPNEHDQDGNDRAPELLVGSFNSPHGITVGSDGSVWVSEWCIGGRLVQLRPDR